MKITTTCEIDVKELTVLVEWLGITCENIILDYDYHDRPPYIEFERCDLPKYSGAIYKKFLSLIEEGKIPEADRYKIR